MQDNTELDTTTTLSPTDENFKLKGYSIETFWFRPKPEPFEGGEAITVKSKDGTEKTAYKRPPFKAWLPLVNKESLTTLLTDPTKAQGVLGFLVDLANAAVYQAAQGQINDLITNKLPLTQENIKDSILDLYTLATTAPVITTRGIAKETWAEFKVDFVQVLTSAHGISVDGATKASKLIADDRLACLKTAQVAIINRIQELLSLWFSSTTPDNQDKFLPILEDMTNKIETYKAQGEQSFLDSIS